MSSDESQRMEDATLAEIPDEALERYARHLVLHKIGPIGQTALLDANIAIVGLGGIGCPVAQYLAGSGVGSLSLYDEDLVSLSNLSRQLLFGVEDIGRPKVDAAAKRLIQTSPDCQITPFRTRLMPGNAEGLLMGHDLIIDGTDTYASRCIVAKAAHALKVPLLSASVIGTDGQLAIFSGTPKRSYMELFPETHSTEANCAQVGVLSSAAGSVGTMAASVAIKIIVESCAEQMDGQCALISIWPPSIYWVS